MIFQLRTPLFVGFSGFVSKEWIAHDCNAYYRGLYEWVGATLAEDYVRALWWSSRWSASQAPFTTEFCRDFDATSTWPILPAWIPRSLAGIASGRD